MRKILGTAAALYSLPAAAVALPRLAEALGLETHLVDSDAVALTFDDGPHPEGTPAILEELARLDLKATFFLSGEQVVRHPALAGEIVIRGHTVGSHGYRHVLLTARPPGSTRRDLVRSLAAIADATGEEAKLYRPPYGVANPPALLAARRACLRTVLWSRWGRDWESGATATSVAALATRNLRGGEILLLHDSDHYAAPGSWRATVAALPSIAEIVEHAGLRVRCL